VFYFIFFCFIAVITTAKVKLLYYRATRMHSADYAVARCLSVHPSVCHTSVFCLNGYTYPQSFFIIG